ncbi:hypothetical protein SASPL_150807 [Salvia splendens]|uniref:Protein BIG GRAIN 1-like B n=1 Tax=Salvia splendens TaxID=180675 RepID=A0A8X8Z305_SALSN|nr:protein BIG GRAIN 1-like B [Salvia splendens]KAG6389339.1 hypothetical protein SASPL_150807 [Salvia splendens]
MYAREKLCRNQSQKSRKNDKNPPSFSSTLLDEIYRSIDANADKSDGYREAARTSLVEKWMEKERAAAAAAAVRRKNQEAVTHENDVVFFSSTSSSSDSSGALSSSDTEFFASATRSKTRLSCFTTRPKPLRTGTRSESGRTGPVEDDLIKSKSRALKIYANLKKVKQPISPGGRLTSFINSLFSNAGGKKIESQDDKSCSSASASAYSRSCLSKYSGKTRDGERRRVRFEPVNEEIVDRYRNLGSGDSGRFGRPPLPPVELKVGKKAEFIAKRQNSKRVDVLYNDDEEDCLSDSSSDLFELDHLAFFGSNRYSEELPVYETTHFDTNCAIASRLSR